MVKRMIYNDNCINGMKKLETDSIDLIVTDPPYGMSFMGKNWDKALPPLEAFEEMYRVLKPGAFAFVMCAPRSDLQARMSILLEDAGFNIAFTPIYWTFATGFPKAQNISKQIDKRYKKKTEYDDLAKFIKDARLKKGIPQKEIAKHFPSKTGGLTGCVSNWEKGSSVPTSQQWKIIKQELDLDNSFDWLIEQETQRYEAAEREIIGTKSVGIKNGAANGTHEYGLTKSEVDITADATPEAQKYNGAYAGFQPKPALEVVIVAMKPLTEKTYVDQVLNNGKGVTWLDDCKTNNRFPANLLVSNDSLNDHSKFFDLDAWFAIFPKPAKSEKNKGLEDFDTKAVNDGRKKDIDNAFQRGVTQRKNTHPTVKPVKLMSYLITLGSRPGDIILDPFMGSGTTGISAKLTGRKFIGYELEEEYYQIAEARINDESWENMG